jgi:hypothetical protein
MAVVGDQARRHGRVMTSEVMARWIAPGHARAMALDTRAHRHLYLANATVLLSHQVDAAYWREWTLFHLPGGIQLFVLLNVPIVVAVLVGLERLGSPTGGGCRSCSLPAASSPPSSTAPIC